MPGTFCIIQKKTVKISSDPGYHGEKYLPEDKIMTRKTMSLFKGLGAGIAAGMLVGAAASLMMKDSRSSRKKIAKAIDSVETMLDGVSAIFQ